MAALNGLTGVRLIGLAACVLIGACGPGPASSTPPPEPPPEAPTISFHRYTAANGIWTFYAFIDPGGSPTVVVLETGAGPVDAPDFVDSVPVASAMLNPGEVTGVVQYPEDASFCVRFTATNAAGTTSSPPRCIGPTYESSFIVITPAPS
jgi:hypothetical protein